MKSLLLTAALVAATVTAQGQQKPATHTLVVNVPNLRSNTGAVYISLQDPNQKAVQKQAVPVQSGKARIIFRDVPNGTYAVRFFHDENNNKTLDKGIFGVPKEGWGCSNNVKATYGPPSYEDMLFAFDRNKSITLSVN